MAVPTFLAGVLNTDFNYLSRAGVADTITVLNDLNTQLTALGWTCSVTGASPNAVGTYQSLTRSDGAFIKIVATQPAAATTLSYVVTDSAGLTMVGAGIRQYIDAGGTEVRIYGSKFGVWVDSMRATPETWGGGIMDQTPEALAVPKPTFWSTVGPRSGGGIAQGGWNYFYYLDPTSNNYAATNQPVALNMPSNGTRLTQSGSLLFMPVEVVVGGAAILLGRVFHTLLTDSANTTVGAELTVPLDTGVTGVFKCLGFAITSFTRVCVRKS